MSRCARCRPLSPAASSHLTNRWIFSRITLIPSGELEVFNNLNDMKVQHCIKRRRAWWAMLAGFIAAVGSDACGGTISADFESGYGPGYPLGWAYVDLSGGVGGSA